MADPERKKRLEEIRLRKARLKNMINNDEKKKEQSSTSIEQEAKKLLEQEREKIQFKPDAVVDKTAELLTKIMRSKKNQKLEQVNFTEEFPAFKSELYDEGTQWYDENKYDDEEDSENEEVKDETPAKPREPLVFQKNKQIRNKEENKFVDKKYENIPEEEREKYL